MSNPRGAHYELHTAHMCVTSADDPFNIKVPWGRGQTLCYMIRSHALIKLLCQEKAGFE